ncbi:uncharacterized protein LOC120836611, partial [Ixodes scapularis]|uniref:uncharacterized protein LOC120836611 n=1 Tax=Ixodes scapularis TaxID=6945 RepID=UPI001C393138
MNSYQLAQLSILVSFISTTKGSFLCSPHLLSDPSWLSALIAVYVCKARAASWYAKMSMCPPELQAVSGWLVPSPGHSRRMCRVLTTEFLWHTVRLTLPPKKKTPCKEGKILILGEQSVPEVHQDLLKKGPKFCFEPGLDRVDKLVLSRSVSRRVAEEQRPRCIEECVGILSSYLTSNGLRILLSDKEGFFVILPEGNFDEKANAAVQKNFRQVKEQPQKVKAKALQLLGSLNLERVLAEAKKEKNLMLEVFFTAKTHKPEIPFRTVVSERDSWLRAVSGYLQVHLNSLQIDDPFNIPNSTSVIKFLKDNNPAKSSAFSIDVEELYYSMPHHELMKSVKGCIFELNDETRFRTKSGVSVEGFLELLSMYLKSTFIDWQDNVYVQKSGVCIGSRVAPMLSSIFLGKVDRALEHRLANNTKKVVRYVDDYLVFVEKNNFSRTMSEVLKTFAEEGLGLRFTSETPKEHKIQFLDIQIDVKEDHVCWMHHPRSTKKLLDYRSAHSKLVKNGITYS